MEPNNITSPVISSTPASSGKLIGPIELIKSAWNFYKAHFKTITLIVIIPAIFSIVGSLVSMIGNAFFAFIGFIIYIAGIVLYIVMSGAIIDFLKKISQNPSEVISIKTQYKIGLGFFWSLILVYIIQSLSTSGAFVLFVIPGIIISVYTGLGLYTLCIDGKKGLSALTESYSLIKGRWWGVIGRQIVFALVIIGLMLVVQLIVFIPVKLFSGTSGLIAVIQIAYQIIINVFISSFAIVFMFKLYQGLKATRIANVSTAGFRKWLIAFLIIGPIALIAFMVAFFSIILISLQSARENSLIKFSQQQSAMEQQYNGQFAK